MAIYKSYFKGKKRDDKQGILNMDNNEKENKRREYQDTSINVLQTFAKSEQFSKFTLKQQKQFFREQLQFQLYKQTQKRKKKQKCIQTETQNPLKSTQEINQKQEHI